MKRKSEIGGFDVGAVIVDENIFPIDRIFLENGAIVFETKSFQWDGESKINLAAEATVFGADGKIVFHIPPNGEWKPLSDTAKKGWVKLTFPVTVTGSKRGAGKEWTPV